MRYDPTDYLYASARIRALESHLTGREKWNQLLELPSPQAILDALSEQGIEKGNDPMSASHDVMKNAFRAVAESVPDPRLTLFLQYPYDCHNAKALEKCHHRGTDPAPLLIDLGSVAVTDLLAAPREELPRLLPPHLGEALQEARTVFAKTADPRSIDLILDRALFADMAQAAAPFPLAANWVQTRADLLNLSMCHRLLRMQSGEATRTLLADALLPCGKLDQALLLACADEGEEHFYDMLSHTPYAGVFEKNASHAQTEKRIDDALTDLIRASRTVTFGAEVPISYLLAADTESKNLRILLSGKAAGASNETIRARMRECYV